MFKADSTKGLQNTEWVIFTLFISIMMGITLTTIVPEADPLTSYNESHWLMPQDIEIYVCGAVKIAKSIKLPKTACMRDLLKVIELEDDADTSKLILTKKLRQGQKVTIPTKSKRIRKIENSLRDNEKSNLKGRNIN